MTIAPDERAQAVFDKIIEGNSYDKNGNADVPALIASAIKEAIRDELNDVALNLEHALETLTDAERQPEMIGNYIRLWARRLGLEHKD